VQTRLFIDGELTDGLAGRGIDVINPADATVLATVAEAGAEDVDTGHPISDTTVLDVPRTAATYRYFGGIADKHEGSVVPAEAGFLNYVQHEPIGVAGSIVPWNFPLMFTSWKLGPALAAGNTTVVKASELTPMTSLRLAELIAEVGFPPGVVNIVPGYGHVAGPRLAERLQLELGGKGANIVFADGFYLQPTIIKADPGSPASQEEIFGPVVTVTTFATDEEAIAIANDTEYGLGGGLWTSDLSRAHRVAAAMRSGMVWVNCYKRVSPGSPFGGTGRSGYGREMGFAAMEEYTTRKSVWINVDAPVPDWYAP
jgi:acyl-CoA reductase-like NAD-dependent aldehyde dehydrogenase